MSVQPTVVAIEDWLQKRAPGYRHLSQDDRQAILQFTLLWSLFEATLCYPEPASVQLFWQKVGSWGAMQLVGQIEFIDSLAHFRDRYFQAGAFTPSFSDLNFRRPDRVGDVQAVLNGTDNRPDAVLVALLTIIYRLRNNLFHGPKWMYRLAGQTPNFAHANVALIALLEQEGGL